MVKQAVIRGCLRGLLGALIVSVWVLLPASTTACSKSGDDATGPAAKNLCSEALFDSGGAIGFNLGCSSVTYSVSGITYDQFGRRTSYDYDMACSNGSNRYYGRVSNITYNSIGQALTWDYTVNGSTCRKS